MYLREERKEGEKQKYTINFNSNQVSNDAFIGSQNLNSLFQACVKL
jgi:hypothetical protein